MNPREQFETYIDVFSRIGWVGVVIGLVLLLCSPLLKKGMAGVH